MTAEICDDLLEAGPDDRRDRLAAGFVTSLVALTTGVSPKEITARTRACAQAAQARQMAMYLTHTAFAWSMARTAAAFNRDRTTASHACHRIEDLRDDAAFDAQLSALEVCLRHTPGLRARA